MKINFFEYKKLYSEYKKDYQRIFNNVCSRGAFILQKDLEDFEHSLSKFLNIKYAVGTNDGTNALIIGLLANNINLVMKLFYHLIHILQRQQQSKLVGAKPVFADINLKTILFRLKV